MYSIARTTMTVTMDSFVIRYIEAVEVPVLVAVVVERVGPEEVPERGGVGPALAEGAEPGGVGRAGVVAQPQRGGVQAAHGAHAAHAVAEVLAPLAAPARVLLLAARRRVHHAHGQRRVARPAYLPQLRTAITI